MRLRENVFRAAVLAGAAAAAIAGAQLPATASARSGGSSTWATAQAVPVPDAMISSVACAPGGYCATAAGPDVLTGRNGAWGKPRPVDTSALGASPTVDLRLVACPSAGNCVVAGTYESATSGGTEPVVASERHGVWGPAQPVDALHADPGVSPVTAPVALACSSAGNCAMAADLTSDDPDQNAFESSVVAEKNGVWGTPDIKLNVGALSCTKLACFGAGPGQFDGELYRNYVDIERNGTWITRRVDDMPRLAVLLHVSCSADESCTVLGRIHRGLFSITEQNTSAGKPKLIPGTGSGTKLGWNPQALSCPSAVSCTVAGLIQEPGFGGLGRYVPFAAAQRNGAWGKPQTIPGAARLNPIEQGLIGALSCTAPGQCSAGGSVNGRHAFVVTQANGRWGRAMLVPGIIKLESGGASNLTSLACWAARQCVAGGYVYPHNDVLQAIPFLVSEH